ncbi:MAG TPA: aminotransferase class IV [Rhabdochlamydiaceae bacterium]|nr:aminotransferase class IV [Rhabdochlamydiaceae bacterium]
MITYVNNEIIEGKGASISIFDLGLTRGYGAFDRLRTYGERPFHLDDHLQRLQFSSSQIHLPLPKSLAEIKEIILQMLKKSPYQESDIRIIVTGGTSSDGLSFSGESSLIIHLSPFLSIPQRQYEEGIKASTSRFMRSFPECKTTHYLPAIVALEQGKKIGAAEVLFCNGKNEILEGATSNFFAFKNGRLITAPGPDILFGFTREITLNLAKPHFPIEKRNLHLDELESIDEAFVTSSNREILSIVKIDGQTIGKGIPGPQTQFLHQKFRDYTQKETWEFLGIF